jgi:hypothetical protein
MEPARNPRSPSHDILVMPSTRHRQHRHLGLSASAGLQPESPGIKDESGDDPGVFGVGFGRGIVIQLFQSIDVMPVLRHVDAAHPSA